MYFSLNRERDSSRRFLESGHDGRANQGANTDKNHPWNEAFCWLRIAWLRRCHAHILVVQRLIYRNIETIGCSGRIVEGRCTFLLISWTLSDTAQGINNWDKTLHFR